MYALSETHLIQQNCNIFFDIIMFFTSFYMHSICKYIYILLNMFVCNLISIAICIFYGNLIDYIYEISFKLHI